MKKTDKKSRILTHATDLFSTLGVRRTTVDKIAEEAGIGKGTIYYYYDNKSDILLDCYMGNLSRIRARAFKGDEGKSKPLLLKLKEMLHYISEETKEDPFVHTIFEEYKKERLPDIEMCFKKSEEDAVKLVKHLLEEGKRTGKVKNVPIDLTAFLIVRMMFDYNLDYPANQQSDEEFMQLLEHMLVK